MMQFLNVSKYYGNRLIFDHINCFFEMGTFTCLLGTTGSGKSTLFQLILNEILPDAGEILYLQKPLGRLNEAALAQHRQHIGVVHQKLQFLPQATTEMNIFLPLLIKKLKKEEHREKVMIWGEQLGLLHCLQRPVGALSLGEQQCVSVLRALIHDPILILADEPTQHLNDELAQVVIDLLYDACLKGASVIMAAPTIKLIPQEGRMLRIEQHQILEI